MSNDEEERNLRKKREEEGSFKRVVSTFRDTVEKGGRFEPEKG